MFITPIQNALLFIITTSCNIYINIILVRFLLQSVNADFYNSFSQFIYSITNPIIIPLRKIIPKFRNIEYSVLVLALIIQILEIIAVLYIKGFNIQLNIYTAMGLCIRGAGDLIDSIIVIYLFFIFILVILSWIQPSYIYNPIIVLIVQITNPLFLRISRIISNTGTIDFTPMIAMFILVLLRILISEPIIKFGNSFIITVFS